MNTLLVNSPWIIRTKKGVRAGSRWPHLKAPEEENYLPFPFFLAYANNLLKKNEISSKIIDAIAEDLSYEQFYKKVETYFPNLILLEISTPSLKNDLEVINKLKAITKAKIAVAGMAKIDEELLKKNKDIDFGLVGEYEFTLLELVKNHNKDYNNIRGLIYREKNKIVVNPKRPLHKSLDDFPWPYNEDLPMKKYHDCPGGIPIPSAQIWASRGCPYSCTFCAWPQIMYEPYSYRVRSIKDVVDEIEFLKNKGFRSFYFDDDTFNVGKKRILELCSEIKKRKINIPWAIMARADLMDKEILLNMKDAGLFALKYGVESSSQELLNACNKNMNIKKVKENILLTKKLGIKVHLTFTFGLLGETKKTIQNTTNFALKMDPESVQFSITTPFPGTKYYEELDQKKQLIENKIGDGNFNAIIKNKNLSPEYLEHSIKQAYKIWCKHKNKKKILKQKIPFRLFKKCLREHGLKYTIKHTIYYLLKDSNSKKIINKHKQKSQYDIILIMCPFWSVSQPPIGLGLLAEYLKSKNLDSKVIDLNIEFYNDSDEQFKQLWNYQNIDWKETIYYEYFKREFSKYISKYLNLILKYKPTFVGFSVNKNSLISLEVAKRLKEIDSSVKIIFGGPGVCLDNEREELYQGQVVDAFIVGDGEEKIFEVINSMKNKKEFTKGVVYKKGEKYVGKPEYNIIHKLKEINPSSLAYFDIHKYKNFNLMPISFSRGCMNDCIFCSDAVYQGPLRTLKAEKVFDSIMLYIKEYNLRSFSFNDLAINSNIKELEKLLDFIIKSKEKVKWYANAVSNRNLDSHTLKKMKKSGCKQLVFGIETGSDKLLKIINKKTTIEEFEEILTICKKERIKVGINLIIGIPGETKKDLEITKEFLRINKNKIDFILNLSEFVITPRSYIEKNHEEFGITLPENHPFFWYDNKGNNREKRINNFNLMKKFIEKVGITIISCNKETDYLPIVKSICNKEE